MAKIQNTEKDAGMSTRERIIREAGRLFSQKGFLGVSMSDIAQQLNITKPALYYHFASKTVLYESVLDDAYERLSSTISEALTEPTQEEKLGKLIKSYLTFGLSEKNLIKASVLEISQEAPHLAEKIIQCRMHIVCLVAPLVKESLEDEEWAVKADRTLLTSMLLGTMDGLILEHTLLNLDLDLENIANHMVSVLFRKPLGVQSGREQ